MSFILLISFKGEEGTPLIDNEEILARELSDKVVHLEFTPDYDEESEVETVVAEVIKEYDFSKIECVRVWDNRANYWYPIDRLVNLDEHRKKDKEERKKQAEASERIQLEILKAKYES